MKIAKKINPDKVGAVASTICAVHCVLTGLALGAISVVGLGFLGSVTTEIIFLTIAISVGAFAIYHGIRKHGSYWPALLFAAGLTFMFLKFFAMGGHTHDHPGQAPGLDTEHIMSTAFAVLGGVLLVSFHVVNMRLGHSCGCSHDEDHAEATGEQGDLESA